ncbi:unnamed protein product [Dovyalis caffra]|uniref:Pentatricopeptide repeat-containing protein n=1 Tax=Dovyalis caffra TaxID=77055 RepID=A0AAV1RXY7_9ROSI|nr:unnamed protein product [Dovyalis caffra]
MSVFKMMKFVPSFKMMKFVPSTTTTLRAIIKYTVTGPPKLQFVSDCSYSTTPTGRTKKPWTDAMNELYSRIASFADQRITISPFLNQWFREGQPINKYKLREFITELRFHKRYAYALELSVFVVRIVHCTQTGNPEKINNLMQEMEQNGIGCDKFAHSIQLSAYASVADIEGIEKTLTRMESDPNIFLDWTTYTAAAKGYTKVGLIDKALEMLKKSERLITGKRSETAYDSLITLYAATGKTNEVLRIWELYKKNKKFYKEAYICIITSLLKLDDLENAEQIFKEWEFQNRFCYDILIPNFLIEVYSRKGFVGKAETLIDRAISKGGKPNAKTWYYLATGYVQDGQTLNAVEAMKKAVVVSGRKWKLSNESLATYLECLKEGEIWRNAAEVKLKPEDYCSHCRPIRAAARNTSDIILGNLGKLQMAHGNMDLVWGTPLTVARVIMQIKLHVVCLIGGLF